MIKLTITENEEQQRLDRFLKKYFKAAPLSRIYKMVRKDVKVNGKRASIETLLNCGDELAIYITDEEVERCREKRVVRPARRQFQIAYEDPSLIIVEKPFGLLVHGDSHEKKNTLVNQVVGYLTETGAYHPDREKTFVPAPVNRLDRNTTGLVIFGKENGAIQSLNRMIREKGFIRKFYLTIVSGRMESELHLKSRMEKNEEKNRIKVLDYDEGEGKVMETIARPLIAGEFSLVEVELVTGRTHQIRAHLAEAGFPIIGDVKYGEHRVNRKMEERFGLTTQFLHAYQLFFEEALPPLDYMKGKKVYGQLPEKLESIKNQLFGERA